MVNKKILKNNTFKVLAENYIKYFNLVFQLNYKYLLRNAAIKRCYCISVWRLNNPPYKLSHIHNYNHIIQYVKPKGLTEPHQKRQRFCTGYVTVTVSRSTS